MLDDVAHISELSVIWIEYQLLVHLGKYLNYE